MEGKAGDTYVVQKKIISVHSEDRDIKKYPTPTSFEVELPVDVKNVVSMRLSEIELPIPLYLFSMDDQNLKMSVSLAGGATTTIQIEEGNYTGAQMALELTGKLNAATNSVFNVIYDQIARKLWFTHSTTPFELKFIIAETYDDTVQQYYDNYTKWGLGSYLGFNKKNYNAANGDVNLYAQGISLVGVYYVVAPSMLDVVGDTNIYMELATYNTIDELMPYTERSSDLYFGKYGGKHNSSFAKIPLRIRSSQENYLSNIFFSEPPLERIQKLRFKMRYHDGRPVHFNGLNYNFSIELTALRNDPAKKFTVNRNNYTLS